MAPYRRVSKKEREKIQKLIAKCPLTCGDSYRKFRNRLTDILHLRPQYHRQRLQMYSRGGSKQTFKVIITIFVGQKMYSKTLPPKYSIYYLRFRWVAGSQQG